MIQENTNKSLLINSIVLYLRLGVTSVCGLLTTRFALQALGVNDFGIFSVVGGVISFIAIFNTIMISTSNRFIAVSIGKGDIQQTNEQFNVNLLIHAAIAVFVLILAFPLGRWYIVNHVNYIGSIDTVLTIFYITIIGSIISFIGVPYNGLLMAKERFWYFCSIDMVISVIKVVICYYLAIFQFKNNLFIYACTLSLLTAIPTFLFIIYCYSKFKEIVKLRFVREWPKYSEVLGFSVWVGYGAIASIGKSQGAALIVNNFFNTIMNTALGIATSVNSILVGLATNVSKSISPQITKNYSSGNMERCVKLVCLSSKVSFLFMLLISCPFFVDSEYIFSLWLGEVPDYVIHFSHLLIIDALIGTLNAGVPELVFASGKIKMYQLIVNTLLILSVVVGFFFLKIGYAADYLLITFIVFSAIAFFVRQVVLNKVVQINNWLLIKESYLPSLFITILLVVYLYFIPMVFSPILNILIAECYLMVLCFVFGLKHEERAYLLNAIKAFKLHK